MISRLWILLCAAAPLLCQQRGDVAAGARVFAGSCSPCHGADGAGGRGPDLLARFVAQRPEGETLFHLIRTGIPGSNMPPTVIPDQQTWDLVAFLLSFSLPASAAPGSGDPVAGRAIFWSQKAQCSQCHAVRGEGGHLGPDLSDIGSRPLALIRRAIVDPASKLSLRCYKLLEVKLRDGRTVRGTARHRGNYSIQMVDSGGTLYRIAMNDVQSVGVSDAPAMPLDFAIRLTAVELRDLLGYLSQLTARVERTRP